MATICKRELITNGEVLTFYADMPSPVARPATILELNQQEEIKKLNATVASLKSIINELRPCPGWYCLGCGEKDIPGEYVTFKETHEGCGGKCI